MKYALISLVCCFIFLQYCMWFDSEGLYRTWQLNKRIRDAQKLHEFYIKKNRILSQHIDALTRNLIAVEAHARYDLGMINPNEIFFHIVSVGN